MGSALALGLLALAPSAPALEQDLFQPNLLPGPVRSVRARHALGAPPPWRPGGPELIRYSWGGSPTDGFGHALARLPDLDGDGIDDLVVGASQADPPRRDGKGYVVVLGGGDGRLLLEVIGAVPGARFGESVAAAGDVDGDGRPDIVIGAPGDGSEAPGGGALRVVSGRDGTALVSLVGQRPGGALGSAVAALGDVDDDGHADVLVGAPGTPGDPSSFGRVQLVSGDTGEVLWTHDDDVPGVAYGAALVGLDDVDDDGIPDLAVGAPWDAEAGGRVELLSGADGSRLRRLEGRGQNRYGAALAAVADLDADGLRDLAIGAPDTSAWGSGLGAVTVVSSASTKALLSARGGDPRDGFGASLCGAGDVDGDGTPDLFVGAPASDHGGWRAGRVHVLSGADGTTLLTLDGRAAGEGFGRAVCCLGDLDTTPGDDVVVGLAGRTRRPPALGTVRMLSGADARPAGAARDDG